MKVADQALRDSRNTRAIRKKTSFLYKTKKAPHLTSWTTSLPGMSSCPWKKMILKKYRFLTIIIIIRKLINQISIVIKSTIRSTHCRIWLIYSIKSSRLFQKMALRNSWRLLEWLAVARARCLQRLFTGLRACNLIRSKIQWAYGCEMASSRRRK